MHVLKRFSQSVSVRFEALLDQIEDQEAVVAATLRQVQQGAARVRLHRKRCERQVTQLEQAGAELAAQAEIWRERARRSRDDRQKALECAKRYRAVLRASEDLRQRLEQERALLGRLLEDERAIAAQLGELERRRAALSSREARANARTGCGELGTVDGVFERWEARIEERETLAESTAAVGDSFASGFEREEEAEALERELASLLGEEVAS